MSYSRWSNSRWYTFWHVRDRDQIENGTNAKFTVMDSCGDCDEFTFRAAEIRKNVNDCVRRVTDKNPATTDEAAELSGYMLEFLNDVDHRYPRNGARSDIGELS